MIFHRGLFLRVLLRVSQYRPFQNEDTFLTNSYGGGGGGDFSKVVANLNNVGLLTYCGLVPPP